MSRILMFLLLAAMVGLWLGAGHGIPQGMGEVLVVALMSIGGLALLASAFRKPGKRL